jgi:ABC-type phosphate transport system auxiliary subunit
MKKILFTVIVLFAGVQFAQAQERAPLTFDDFQKANNYFTEQCNIVQADIDKQVELFKSELEDLRMQMIGAQLRGDKEQARVRFAADTARIADTLREYLDTQKERLETLRSELFALFAQL